MKLLVAVAFITFAGASAALATTYSVHDSNGAFSVDGSITTDGALGDLSAGEITGWNLTIAGDYQTVFQTFNLLPGNSTMSLIGDHLTATPTELRYDYSVVVFPTEGLSFSGTFPGDFTASVSYTSSGFGNFFVDIRQPCPPGDCFVGVVGGGRSGIQTIATADGAATPLPPALTLFATGLGALGLLGWRTKKNAAALAA